jgi:hypothetical protein
MIYQTIPASKPGAPTPKVEKRTGDIKMYALDCSALLMPNELAVGKATAKGPVALEFTKVKCRQGRYVIFKVAGGPVNTPHVDYPVTFTVNTSFSNTLEIPLIIRVYS